AGLALQRDRERAAGSRPEALHHAAHPASCVAGGSGREGPERRTGMISKEYAFEAPKQLSEALGLLEKYGDDAKVLAGGMGLVPTMTLGLVQREGLISRNHITTRDYVREDGNVLRIGALTRHDTVRKNPLLQTHCVLLSEAATCIGDVQMRHRRPHR